MDNPDPNVVDNPGPTATADPQPAPTQDPAPAAEPTPAPESRWYDDFSQDLKDNPSIQKFESPEMMAKSYLEIQKLMGHEKVALPKDEEDTVAIDALNRALGVPDEATGYDLSQPEFPEGLEHMEFGTEMFQQVAHKLKLTPQQAQGLQTEYVALLSGVIKQQEEGFINAINEAKSELSKEWGLQFETNVKRAQSVMNKFTESKEEFDHINAKIGNDPVALRWLNKIGTQFGEGSLGEAIPSSSGQYTMTPAQAKVEYDKIMNDPNDVYWAGVRNSQMVQESVRRDRVAYVETLLQQMNAGQPQGPA